jgi:hypothetical protein
VLKTGGSGRVLKGLLCGVLGGVEGELGTVMFCRSTVMVCKDGGVEEQVS